MTQNMLPVAEIAVGLQVTTVDGFAGTVTARQTVIGDIILVTEQGVWVPVTPDTLAEIDPNSVDGAGTPAWGAQDGCPMGISMGCDGEPGCIGECGGTLGADIDVDVLDPAEFATDSMPIFSGHIDMAARRLDPGIYPATSVDGVESLFVVVSNSGAVTHPRGVAA